MNYIIVTENQDGSEHEECLNSTFDITEFIKPGVLISHRKVLRIEEID